jgi:cytochrome P450
MGFLEEFAIFKALKTDLQGVEHALSHIAQNWLKDQVENLFESLRENHPVLVIGNVAIVTRMALVREVYEKDQIFSTKRYGPRIEQVGGPFFLEMPNDTDYQRAFKILHTVVRPDDLENIAKQASLVAAQNLDRARLAGKLDVARYLTNYIPLKIVVEQYLGIPGPDDETLLQWGRAVFADVFVDLTNDAKLTAASLAAGRELRPYLDGLIEQRKADLNTSKLAEADDVLTRLLRLQLSDPDPSLSFSDYEIRNNLIGLLCASIGTISSATVNAIAELLSRPEQWAGAREAALANNETLLNQYIYEALRLRPQAPFLVRECIEEYTLGAGTEHATTLKPGTVVFAVNAAAMMDAAAIPEPKEFRLDRSPDAYLHYGHSLHICFGQYIGQTVMHQVVKQLLLQDKVRQPDNTTIENEGIYPKSFVLEYA